LCGLTLCICHHCGHAADPMLVAIMMFIDTGFWRFCEGLCFRDGSMKELPLSSRVRGTESFMSYLVTPLSICTRCGHKPLIPLNPCSLGVLQNPHVQRIFLL
jgi:hypothetical protein